MRLHKRRCLYRSAMMFLLSLAIFIVPEVRTPAIAQAATADQVNEVRQILEQQHVSKPDGEQLNDAAIDAMIETLNDPYTQFFDAEEWESFSNSLEQHYIGVGIVLVEEDGTVYAEDVIPGSPAEAAGIMPGDALVAADGDSLAGLSVTDVQQKLLGEEGTEVRIGIAREGKRLNFTITRKSIQLPVATGRMMGDGVGYVALNGFTSDAGARFAEQVGKLEQAGMTSLVIDLRGNGGGYLNSAQQIASQFITDGVLASLRSRDGTETQLRVKGDGKPYSVTILVNGQSASATELLAGALEDYGIARLVGTKTYGKGVVQSIYPLKSGGVVKVTVQEYFTPKGRQVEKVGLTPSHVVEGAAQQLIAAYRDAGGKRLSVEFHKGFITVNGVRAVLSNAAWFQSGKWFVNLRLAAAICGADVGYDPATKTVTLRRDDQSYRLTSGDSRMINKNGWNLVDLDTLRAWFPELTRDMQNERLTLTFP